MFRDEAVARIAEDLGFRTGLNDFIITRLILAQSDLEQGKTLPKFLLQRDQPLVLAAGVSQVATPAGFLRVESDEPPRYTTVDSAKPRFVTLRTTYRDALAANVESDGSASGPKVMVVRGDVLDFINPVDQTYNLVWSYYKRAEVLTTNVENAWLADAAGALWLMGEAGWRAAQTLRDASSLSVFEALRRQGRAACFGETLAEEDASGPVYLGANN